MLSRRSSAVLVVLAVLLPGAAARSGPLVTINEENWTILLKGEWMLQFRAPWCPACKDLQKAWDSLADFARHHMVNVAEVDVTKNPGLSGRFLVKSLPTIYHVKDGVFRAYIGPRDKNGLISFVEDRLWREIDPVPDYRNPNSPQMSVVAVFFKLSLVVRDLHNKLVEEKGVPWWASYSLFSFATVALGCVLGCVIVVVVDRFFPTQR